MGEHQTLHQAAVEGEEGQMLSRTAQLAEAVAEEASFQPLQDHGSCLPLTGSQTGFWIALQSSSLHLACFAAMCALYCPC